MTIWPAVRNLEQRLQQVWQWESSEAPTRQIFINLPDRHSRVSHEVRLISSGYVKIVRPVA